MKKINDNKPWQLAAISMLLVAAYCVQAADACATDTPPINCDRKVGDDCNASTDSCSQSMPGKITAVGTHNGVVYAARGVDGYWASSVSQDCVSTCHIRTDCNGAAADGTVKDGPFNTWTMSDDECTGDQ
jgi:hypothetical protein